jgi:hypothetical protein
VQVSHLKLPSPSPSNTRRSCITARRRRKAGRQPFYGTGWAARPGANGTTNTAAPYYNNNNGGYNSAPAPPYDASQTTSNAGYYNNNTGGANAGYYGQQNGVELQQPSATYGGQNAYQPPPGPPPGKGDGIVR